MTQSSMIRALLDLVIDIAGPDKDVWHGIADAARRAEIERHHRHADRKRAICNQVSKNSGKNLLILVLNLRFAAEDTSQHQSPVTENWAQCSSETTGSMSAVKGWQEAEPMMLPRDCVQ